MNAAEAFEIAQKARIPLIEKQYEDIKKDITRRVKNGDLYLNIISIYPEVKKRLLLEGFEVNDSLSVTISWENAKITIPNLGHP